MSPETRIAVLEERMKTVQAEAKAMQAEYKTDIARLAEESAKRDAKWDVEAAKRETRCDIQPRKLCGKNITKTCTYDEMF